MATDLSTAVYPFDPTGSLASNKITGEQHILTSANYRDYKFIVPKLAPFFEAGLSVSFKGVDNIVRTLSPGIDYILGHEFIAASRACSAPIYGSILFLDTTLAGVVTIDNYQTLGGTWTQDDAKIAEILADSLHNPRVTAWDQVVDMPVSFPVIDHQWDLVDLVGASDIVTVLNTIEVALRQTGTGGLTDHINNTSNPHLVTKAQVGLGNVRNLLTADLASAQAGTSDDFFMTPLSTAAEIDAKVGAAFTAHSIDTSNPHATTAAQVGAYSIAQMNTLLANKLASNGVAYDTARFDGKNSLDFKDWVNAGTSANTLKFNGMTTIEYKDYVVQNIDLSTLDLYTRSQTDTLLSGKLNTNGVAYDTARFSGLDVAAFTAQVLSGTAADSSKFNGMLPADYATSVLSGTANNSMHLEGLTKAQLVSEVTATANSSTARQITFSQYSAATPVPNLWTLVGSRQVPDSANPYTTADMDMVWLVSGTEPSDHKDSGLWLVRTSVRQTGGDNVIVTVTSLNGIDTGATFGHTIRVDTNGATWADIWVKTPDIRGRISITEMLSNIGSFGDITALPDTVEPTSITYATADNIALRSEVESAFAEMAQAFVDLKASINA